MIIIADSGSTKADWKVVKNGKILQTISTMGLNPFFHGKEVIFDALKNGFENNVNPIEVKQIYFYGAGCSNPDRNSFMQHSINCYFKNAEIEVEHDILAAARATCGTTPGIACILGTGSNSCLYDGTKIIDNLPSLGFMLGDEGSGSYLGKMLIKKFFYRELPQDLLDAFNKKYNLTKEDILDALYNKHHVNVFLAKFSRFYAENNTHPLVREMIKNAFTDFYSSLIVKYDGYKNVPIHFVGSISFIFRDILEEVSKDFGTTLGRTIKQPIEELVNFHLHASEKVKS